MGEAVGCDDEGGGVSKEILYRYYIRYSMYIRRDIKYIRWYIKYIRRYIRYIRIYLGRYNIV